MSNPVCPKCFEEASAAVYMCRTYECPRGNTPQPGAGARHDPAGAPLCADCGKPLTARVCPHCSHPLDRTTGEVPELPFVIAGASGCGKSNFLAVLLDQIRQEMGKRYDCALYPLGGDATMELYDRLYYHPLFVQGCCPASTEPDDVEPLDYSLVFAGKEGRPCDLAFYDSCGATFDSEAAVLQHNRNLAKAKGILLLIDPSQLSGVRDLFRTQGKPVLDNDAGALLTRIIHLIRGAGGPGGTHQKIQTPIAVCVTKLDTIRRLLDPASFVAYPSRHLREPFLDRIDWDACNLEVQSLFESWTGKELLNQIKAQFEHSGFFAFSALGDQPVDGHLLRRISPHRVLDPFLWLLWQNQIIQCR